MEIVSCLYGTMALHWQALYVRARGLQAVISSLCADQFDLYVWHALVWLLVFSGVQFSTYPFMLAAVAERFRCHSEWSDGCLPWLI